MRKRQQPDLVQPQSRCIYCLVGGGRGVAPPSLPILLCLAKGYDRSGRRVCVGATTRMVVKGYNRVRYREIRRQGGWFNFFGSWHLRVGLVFMG